MSYNLKKQDTFGIFAAIAITAISVGFVLVGNTFYADGAQNQVQNTEIIGIGGMTDVKESINISFNNKSIDLDSSDGLLRANVTYEGFQPQMGRVMLEVYSSSGEKVKESELQLRQRGNDVYEADFTQFFDKNEFQNNKSMLGQHIMRISTDHGSLAKQSTFNVIMSSQEQPKQNIIAMESNVELGIGGILSTDNPIIGFDVKVMEKDLENMILKKYLTKILKEYYDGELSKDEIKRFTEFKDINCDFTDQKGKSLQLSCEIKSNN